MRADFGSRDHPLEFAYFYDLIGLVTGSATQWGEGRELSAGDLAGLLEGCSSLDDVRDRLSEKIRSISLWDEVFVRYYEDEEARERWRKLKKTIASRGGAVRQIRDRVMHHRPVFHWELDTLRDARNEVQELVQLAMEQLPDEEREASVHWAEAIVKMSVQADLFAAAVRSVEMLGRVRPLDELLAAAARSAEMLDMVRPPDELLAAAARSAEMLDMVRPPDELLAAAARSVEALDRPSPSAKKLYMGSTRGDRFHSLSCGYVNRIVPENRVYFASRDQAVSQGYLPCSVCKP
jgi:hypothetical protein